MKQQFISFVKGLPFARGAAKAALGEVNYLRERLWGTRVQEKFWQRRHLVRGGDWQGNEEWIAGYWNSRNHPHRAFLVEKILSHRPLSILEIGCNCGPNLYLLQRKHARLKLAGLDINPTAIEMGKKYLESEHMTDIDLRVGTADALDGFSDAAFDIVFTDAVLMYIGPDKIDKVLNGIFRVAKAAVMVLEWHDAIYKKNTACNDTYIEGHWKRNYHALFKGFVPEQNIHVSKLPGQLWPGKYWSELGYVVEAAIDKRSPQRRRDAGEKLNNRKLIIQVVD